MVGEDTFYERANDRDDGYAQLVQAVALDDPEWTLAFVTWLRGEANLRSAAVVAAVEAVRARLQAGGDAAVVSNRAIIAAALRRADEPGELLAYWIARYGRTIPKPVKRGVADAVRRLYDQHGLLKYDTVAKPFRFGDVIDLTHPQPAAPWQGDLFRVALERRHRRLTLTYGDQLPMLVANRELRQSAARDASVLLDAERLRASGFTWEDALSLAGSTVDKASLWAALVPSMGYMALLRNLRNFDEAGLPDAVARTVAQRLADPHRVATSRQLPYRFLAAYETTPSLRWSDALDRALAASVANVPALPGRSLVLVDTSASMTSGRMSRHSTMTPAKAAAVFGVTLAIRGQAELVGFADGVFRHDIPRGASILRETDASSPVPARSATARGSPRRSGPRTGATTASSSSRTCRPWTGGRARPYHRASRCTASTSACTAGCPTGRVRSTGTSSAARPTPRSGW